MPTRSSSRPHHTGFDPSLLPQSTTAVAACAVAANKWQIDFSNPVQVISLPVDFLVNGAPATACVQDSPTRITLAYAVNVAAGQDWEIPARSLNVRTPTGGFVAAATGTF